MPADPAAQIEKKDGMLQATLENGLSVILVEDHSAPVVALNVWVRVGSADERDEQWGMAHVHEHMLFKGTQRRGVGEIASTVEGAGGNINAFTSYDMTVYHITMASRDATRHGLIHAQATHAWHLPRRWSRDTSKSCRESAPSGEAP